MVGYYVERATAGSDRWMRVTKNAVTECRCTVSELIEQSVYEFRVIARNKIGEGLPGDKTTPVTAKDPFGERLFSALFEINFIGQSVLLFLPQRRYLDHSSSSIRLFRSKHRIVL